MIPFCPGSLRILQPLPDSRLQLLIAMNVQHSHMLSTNCSVAEFYLPRSHTFCNGSLNKINYPIKTRDGTAEPVSRDQILRPVRGQGDTCRSFSADHEQDWKPYPIYPYSAICDDHTYKHTKKYSLFFFPRTVFPILSRQSTCFVTYSTVLSQSNHLTRQPNSFPPERQHFP